MIFGRDKNKVEKVNCDTTIAKLEDLTEKLPELHNFMNSKQKFQGTKELRVSGGILVMRGLFKNSNMAISRVLCPKDSMIEKHVHKEAEWLGVAAGKMGISIDGKEEIIVNQFEAVYVPPNKPHGARWLEPSEIWAITMPASKDFPEG